MPPQRLTVPAKTFIHFFTLVGLLELLHLVAVPLHILEPQFLCYLVLALISSGLKVTLPGVTGTMSVSYLFILLGLLDLGLPEAEMLGVGSALVQIYWHAKRKPPIYQVLFNLSVVATAIGIADLGIHSPFAQAMGGSLPVKLFFATGGYFLANTFPIACAISLTEKKDLTKIWRECYFWSFPYYLLTATIVCLLEFTNRTLGWEFSLLALPAAWVLHRSYRLYTTRLQAEKERVQQEKAHVEEMNALHLRTIATLALAIEAKDQTAHSHFHRVQHYAVGVGREMGLDESELNALRAAALLHDIGKLGVPEHIITKPGKLTPQEFEKMKIHPVIGAEILQQVNFPYPVVPIVKAHHEKWDGTGYPFGLAGEQIPIGARILAAVDCLDALASDRQYRRALPLDEAMQIVISESGKSHDPKVVEILAKRYIQLEQEATQLDKPAVQLSIDAKIERGDSPAAGFESAANTEQPGDFRSQIAAAGREAQFTLELVSKLGDTTGMAETLSVLSSRLTQLIPCDAIAVWQCKENLLTPVYVDGYDRMLFSSLRIPLGEGLSGWVAKHNKPILNGNPTVEPGYLNDPRKFSVLRSALAIPIEGVESTLGVLALYRADADAFALDHLRILSGVSSKIGQSFENALKYRRARSFGDHRLSHRSQQSPRVIRAFEGGTRALRTARVAPRGHGVRSGQFQGSERPFWPQRRQ